MSRLTTLIDASKYFFKCLTGLTIKLGHKSVPKSGVVKGSVGGAPLQDLGKVPQKLKDCSLLLA